MPDAGVTDLTVAKTAKITFVLPTKPVDDLQLTFDDRPVPIDAATRTFSVTPGRHRVVADGTRSGARVHYEGEMTAVDGELVTIPLELTPAPNEVSCCGIPPCLREAKTQAEARECVETGTIHRGGCASCSASSGALAGDVLAPALVLLLVASWNKLSVRCRRTSCIPAGSPARADRRGRRGRAGLRTASRAR